MTDFSKLSREEIKARYEGNVAERNRLSEENKVLRDLYKNAVSTAKVASAQARIEALQAKLAALTAPAAVPVEG